MARHRSRILLLLLLTQDLNFDEVFSFGIDATRTAYFLVQPIEECLVLDRAHCNALRDQALS